MATPARELHQESAYAQNLDSAVEEVFRLMMNVTCVPVETSGPENGEMITAVIGLAGAMSGACTLRCGLDAALRMAESMVGVRPEQLDDMVKDAIGEVCNMVAGAWKGRHSLLASGCMLSTPAVVTGTNYQLHMQQPEFRVDRGYRFDDQLIHISLVCESIQ
ncbi:chemotaxis protein CheX [Pseudacidobacterium ailaaui]|jgi:chemotaxis protein CheX|uniref:chemotaxis protein CheX n=1 Tax=Pseudacidobacterium ailaaui TaxID=1382359 RepID=UPI00047AB6DD|nr:chemotaxis protein CheX [Pseudacidobacterium ailaaui]MBX6358453.1 chemotaxis protein CheX [Pseudacidobacterium ailaaui]MCL6463999.1 chemotaxis protein CheX [Pseudacidobacterium ailaaui]MDI3254271.1 chemotaxis protein CheX [Bacillota bacterium]